MHKHTRTFALSTQGRLSVSCKVFVFARMAADHCLCHQLEIKGGKFKGSKVNTWSLSVCVIAHSFPIKVDKSIKVSVQALTSWEKM